MIALDTETTGLDHWHGAKPYLVTTCDEQGQQQCWEWHVDPFTREPDIPTGDLEDIRFLVESVLSDSLVCQNGKFDYHSLNAIIPGIKWPWDHYDDTLTAGHLLHSAQRHDLASMVMLWLGHDIAPFEGILKLACHEARRMARTKVFKAKHGEWRLAKAGLREMPSAKGSSTKEAKGAESELPWKFDAWLPRAIAFSEGWSKPREDCEHKYDQLDYKWVCSRCSGHRWWTICSEYANIDSWATLALFKAQWPEIEARGLVPQYREALKILPVLADMEQRGLTKSISRSATLRTEFAAKSEHFKDECLVVSLKRGFDLKMPKGAAPNKSLREFCFEVLKLEPAYNPKAKTSAPTLNKDAMAHYRNTLERDTDEGRFVHSLLDKRAFDNSISFIDNYSRYAIAEDGDVSRLHPSFNSTGTIGTRLSCSNPNGMNIPVKDPDEQGGGRTVRWLFGPAPGREWWALDYENIELRIPAYEGRIQRMIDLFERPQDPPFFGSYHLLNVSIIYPDEFLANPGRAFKKHVLYKPVKSAGFALIFGCMENTFDRTAKKKGAYKRLKAELPDLFRLSDRWVRFAEKHGYVETLPDRTVDPKHGYPVECVRGEYNRISPTEPFNYHIQGTAGLCARKAMPRCHEALKLWTKGTGQEHSLILQVHDELIFDLPALGRRNWPKVKTLRRLMEQSGDDIGVPLRVSVSYHPHNWDEAVDWRKKSA